MLCEFENFYWTCCSELLTGVVPYTDLRTEAQVSLTILCVVWIYCLYMEYYWFYKWDEVWTLVSKHVFFFMKTEKLFLYSFESMELWLINEEYIYIIISKNQIGFCFFKFFAKLVKIKILPTGLERLEKHENGVIVTQILPKMQNYIWTHIYA